MAERIVDVDQVDRTALVACFNAAFDGYVAGTVHLDLAGLDHFLERQGAHPALSRVAVDGDGVPVGFAFVGRRVAADGWRSRIGGMGVAPTVRGRGVAPALLQRTITDAAERGDRWLELEVFAQNLPAWRLYRAHDFAEVTALNGYARAVDAAAHDDGAIVDPVEVPLADAARWLADQPVDLPFQQSPAALGGPASRGNAWRHGDALLVFDVRPAGIALRLAYHAPGAADDLAALARTLASRHPGERLPMPQLLAPAFGGDALERAGWRREVLSQWWMRRAPGG